MMTTTISGSGPARCASNWARRRLAFLALALAAPLLPAQDYGSDKPPAVATESIPLTAEEKKALAAVEVRLAGVEALAAKIDDPAYKASTDSAIADLKKRRAALEKKFDAGLYEALMHAVISRYQIIALWLTPPRVLPPAAKSARMQPPQTPPKPRDNSAAKAPSS